MVSFKITVFFLITISGFLLGLDSAVADPQTQTIGFCWSPPNNSSSVDHYVIYESVNGLDYVQGGVIPDTSYSIEGIGGCTYRVKVAAVDLMGQVGPPSEESEPYTVSRITGVTLRDSSSNSENYSNQLAIRVDLAYLGVPTQVRLAEDCLFTIGSTGWQDLTTDVFYTLTPGDGRREVYAQLRDYLGTISQVASDTIFLDMVSPQTEVLIPNGGEEWRAGQSDTVRFKAEDNIKIDCVDILLSYDGGERYPDTIAFHLSNDSLFIWQIIDSLISDSCRIMVVAYDQAGNVGMDESDSLFSILPAEDVDNPPWDYADQDILGKGTVFGTYTNTHASDNAYESITEVESGGKPTNRYSLLEHKWTIDVTGGQTVTFYVEAYQSASTDGDKFDFEYSTNDDSYSYLLTVNSTSEMVYSAGIPNTFSGTVYIRVKDTDRTKGNGPLDTIYIDEMYIESVGTPPPPGKMHVDGIDITPNTNKNRTKIIVDVWVVNSLRTPLPDATVYGTWRDLNRRWGMTDGSGKAALESRQIRKACQWFVFCVDSITKPAWTYDPSANVETCDSSYYCWNTQVAENASSTFLLSQNCPNPFKPETDISYVVPANCKVRLDVYNLLGQKVAELIDEFQSAGIYNIRWNASEIPSGIYFYRITAGQFTAINKMILLK